MTIYQHEIKNRFPISSSTALRIIRQDKLDHQNDVMVTQITLLTLSMRTYSSSARKRLLNRIAFWGVQY